MNEDQTTKREILKPNDFTKDLYQESVYETLKKITPDKMLIELNSENMGNILSQLIEIIRQKNENYFIAKRSLSKKQQELQEIKDKVMLDISSEHNRKQYPNQEARVSALGNDIYYQRAKRELDEWVIAVDELEQDLWLFRGIKSDIKTIAELQTAELKQGIA